MDYTQLADEVVDAEKRLRKESSLSYRTGPRQTKLKECSLATMILLRGMYGSLVF